MSLADAIDLPHEVVLTDAYYTLLETHIVFLRADESIRQVTINGQIAEKYTGDFYGLLNELSIDKKYHYLVMRVNRMKTSTDYDGVVTTFLVPTIDLMDSFISTYLSREN